MNISNIVRIRYATKAYDEDREIPLALKQQLMDLLRFSPSSVNTQPWHFFVLSSEASKQQIVPAVTEPNRNKVLNASLVVVIAAKAQISDDYLETLLAQEKKDGRFASDEAMTNQDKGRRYYVGLNSETPQRQQEWMARQAYLSLGFLLLGAATLGLDATPMEGFSPAELNAALELEAKGLSSIVIATIGYRSERDFNAKLPKSRLPEEAVITEL